MNIHGADVGGASRCEPHQMLIWRDKKRGTKVFKVTSSVPRFISLCTPEYHLDHDRQLHQGSTYYYLMLIYFIMLIYSQVRLVRQNMLI